MRNANPLSLFWLVLAVMLTAVVLVLTFLR
jgi:hypothetical protein